MSIKISVDYAEIGALIKLDGIDFVLRITHKNEQGVCGYNVGDESLSGTYMLIYLPKENYQDWGVILESEYIK
jgi:hypothetical protein